MRVAFLGNHTVGVRTLATLAECAEVVAVVAHPPDPEDGVRYESVFALAESRGLNVARMRPADPGFEDFLSAPRPDLMITADYRYLLPLEVISRASRGAINLHPSLLPKYRGRAPLNWAILHGESELGLTAHCIDAGADTGDIVAQQRFTLEPDEDVGDALRKLYPLYERMAAHVVALAEAGAWPRVAQDHAAATVFPARRPEDGRIDWHQPAERIHRLIRAVAAPYPGAFSTIAGHKVTIWRAEVESQDTGEPPGTVLREEQGESFRVACGRGTLRATKWSVNDQINGPLPSAIKACFDSVPAPAADA
jgi:methionyl-tRNA formyltransferase